MATFEPVGNLLDTYNLSTYNLTFYMLPPEKIKDENRKDAWSSDNGIIIAQSGVTSQIFIEDFSVTSYPGFSAKSRNSTHTKFTMTLQEFSGASLIDKLIAASFELRAESYFQIPYFIELSFKANQPTPHGSMPLPTIPNFKYRWPVMLTGVETSVDEGGATYNITGFHYDEIGQQNTYGVIDKSFSITATTVGGALLQLAKALTERQVEKTTTGLTVPDIYTINVHPTIAKYKLNDESLVNLNRNASMKDSEISDQKISSVEVEKNISIIETINRIVTASPEYQKQAQQTNTPNQNDSADKPDGKIKELHRVVTRSDQLKYDIGRGVYQHNFTYFVRPHLIGNLISNKTDVLINTKDRFNKYLEAGLLKKHYEYIFTGKNDQVLEFDLKFNWAWYANMPSQGGIKTEYAHMAEGRKFSDDMQKLRETNKYVALALNQLSHANTKELDAKEFAKRADYIAKVIATITTTPEEQAIVDRLTAIAKTNRIAFSDRPTKDLDEKTKKRTRYLEEISVQDLESNSKYRKYPLAFLESSIEQDVDGKDTVKSVDSSKTSGAQYVNSLFNQAFSGKSADLIDVQIKIKGDPHWLGATITDLPTTQSNVKNAIHAQQSGTPLLSAGNPASTPVNLTFSTSDVLTTPPGPLSKIPGDQFPSLIEPEESIRGAPAIIFTLNTPELPGVDTGTVRARSTALNGLYLIKQIDHEFSNGKFIQTLYGVIDPSIDIDRVIKDL